MIQLSRDDIDLLLRELELSPELRRALLEARLARTSLPDDMADRLRDLCGERLQRSGFGSDYQVTPVGKQLETLIDKLFVG